MAVGSFDKVRSFAARDGNYQSIFGLGWAIGKHCQRNKRQKIWPIEHRRGTENPLLRSSR
jgi:hypothetical protein